MVLGQSSSHTAEGAAQQQAQDGNHVLGGPPGARLNDKEQRVDHHYSRGPAQHRHNMQQHALHVMESSSSVRHHSIAWCHIGVTADGPGQSSVWLQSLSTYQHTLLAHSSIYDEPFSSPTWSWDLGADSDLTLYEAAGRETASKDATSTITAVYRMTSHHVFRLKTAARM